MAVSMTVTAAACSSGTDEAATTAESTETTTTQTSTSAESSASPTTTTGADMTLADVPVGVGDCVDLSGGESTAAAKEADCGSAESNYKVSQVVRQNSECPADTDQVYYETMDGVERGALCLDIDWVIDGCMSVPFDQPARRVDCADSDATFVSRATRILQNTDVVDGCGGGGYAYSVRKFVVCVEEILPPSSAGATPTPGG